MVGIIAHIEEQLLTKEIRFIKVQRVTNDIIRSIDSTYVSIRFAIVMNFDYIQIQNILYFLHRFINSNKFPNLSRFENHNIFQIHIQNCGFFSVIDSELFIVLRKTLLVCITDFYGIFETIF